MADYWLSFRIADNGHPRRYDNLIEAVNEVGYEFWDGPTSMICIRSEMGIDALGMRLKAAIDDRYDLFVLRRIGFDLTRYAGEAGRGFLAFFPKAKKL